MGIGALFWIAVGLSMDAMAVSACKGLAAERIRFSQCMAAGLYFGLFQALMPLCGYLFGRGFSDEITSVDHWIAFLLLSVIGGKMLLDSRRPDPAQNSSFSPRVLLPLAIATSIDALAVGVSFAFFQVNILTALLIIGLVTFILSSLGVLIGSRAGTRLHARAQVTGGVILILMGLKILWEHLKAT